MSVNVGVINHDSNRFIFASYLNQYLNKIYGIVIFLKICFNKNSFLPCIHFFPVRFVSVWFVIKKCRSLFKRGPDPNLSIFR